MTILGICLLIFVLLLPAILTIIAFGSSYGYGAMMIVNVISYSIAATITGLVCLAVWLIIGSIK